MLTRDPPKQVAAIIALFKDIADEIIVGIDSRLDTKTLDPIVQGASRAFRIKIDGNFANSSWLIRQAKHEWVFFIDGDEVPSFDLLLRLRNLHQIDSQITHAYVGMRWLWPDKFHYLESEPWRDDPQLRLIRRSARIYNWPTGIHEAPRVDGKAVFLPEFVYHLDLCLNNVSTRLGKIERYDKDSKENFIGFSTSISKVFYLPEGRRDSLRTALVPTADTQNIFKILESQTISSKKTSLFRSKTQELELYTEHEIKGPARQDEQRRSTLRIVSAPEKAIWEIPIRISIEVTNTSNWTFQPHRDDGGIAVGWTVVDVLNPSEIIHTGRGQLVMPLVPGESILCPCYVTVPAGFEAVSVRFSLVEEFHEWFPEVISFELQAGEELFDSD
jgi:hypothetical protein